MDLYVHSLIHLYVYLSIGTTLPSWFLSATCTFFRFVFHLLITIILRLRDYFCFCLCFHRSSRLSGSSCYIFRPGCWLFVRFPLVLLFPLHTHAGIQPWIVLRPLPFTSRTINDLPVSVIGRYIVSASLHKSQLNEFFVFSRPFNLSVRFLLLYHFHLPFSSPVIVPHYRY